MSGRRRDNRGKKKNKGRKPRNQGNNNHPSRMMGVLAVTPRVNGIKLQFNADLVLNNATVLVPFAWAYLNLTNPLLVNGGAASVVTFFAGYAAFYRKFRVRKFSVVARFGNAENFFGNGFVTPINFLPTNTLLQNTAAFRNIMTKRKLISPKGGKDEGLVRMHSNVMRFAGFANTNVEDNYVGTTDGSSSPTDNIYAIVAFDTNGVASVSGVFLSLTVTFWVDFMERQTPGN